MFTNIYKYIYIYIYIYTEEKDGDHQMVKTFFP